MKENQRHFTITWENGKVTNVSIPSKFGVTEESMKAAHERGRAGSWGISKVKRTN